MNLYVLLKLIPWEIQDLGGEDLNWLGVTAQQDSPGNDLGQNPGDQWQSLEYSVSYAESGEFCYFFL